ncbi:MAG: PLP-dependent aminotransferase family protein [Burkholderiales bacterium]
MQPHGPFSARLTNLHASPIREILSVIDRPGMVSFAGGLPAVETFPVLSADVIPLAQLQYGPSEGDSELREAVAGNLRSIGLECSMEQILILSGSQQGIDLVAKLFIDAGTPVALESPTYLAALQVFRFFGADFLAFDPGKAGAAWPSRAQPAFVYAIPTFQNPTGRCYSAVEREALRQFCDERLVTLFEDDPYRDLVYDHCDRTPVCARLQRASWIYQGSFSKRLAPGLRLGFLAASPKLVPYLTRLKQAADLHSNRISQWLVLQQLRAADRGERLGGVVAVYRRKRDYFASALERHLGNLATWQLPPGGLFFWLTLARHMDTRTLLPEAIERGVAFMPGEPFYPHMPKSSGALRLNFSHASEENTERGLAILAELLR